MLRRGLIGLGVAAVAVTASVIPAQAANTDAGPDVLACAVNGNTTLLDTVLPTPNTGSYASAETAVCTLADPSSNTDPSVENLSIGSSGTYSNTICGTGTADGTAWFSGTSLPATAHAELPASITYSILFGGNGVPGQGTLTVTGGTHADGPVSGTPPASGIGTLHLSPNLADPDACAPVDFFHPRDSLNDRSGDAEAFAITGAVEIIFPDRGP